MNFITKIFITITLILLAIGCGGSKEELNVKTISCGSNMKFIFRPMINVEFSYLQKDTIGIQHSFMIESPDTFLAKIKYPDYAVKNGIEGLVVVDFIINELGFVDGIQLIKSIGGGCDGAVINEIKKQKFKPAIQNKKRISEWMSVKAKFSLI
jgi:TonB family protein